MSTYVSLFFVIIGMTAVWIMLEVHGRPGKRDNLSARRAIHKSLGYLFVLTFLVMCGFMIRKTGTYLHTLSSRAVIHISLGLFLVPALGLKLLIARRYKRFFNYLPVLGSLIAATAFTLVSLTAGYFFLHRANLDPAGSWEIDQSGYDPHLAFDLVNEKCSKCHSLEQVIGARKNKQGWIKTVVRMAEKDAPHIRPFQAKLIIHYLFTASVAEKSATEKTPQKLSGEALVNVKCSKCHKLDKVYSRKEDRAWWQKTVNQMIENAEEIGELEFLTESQADEIITYLASRK